MKDLNAEEFKGLPDYMHEHFAEIEVNGGKVYRSKAIISQSEAITRYKGKAEELDALKSEYASKAEKAEAERIQALKEKGDFEALYKVESTKNAETLERIRKKDEAISKKANESLINGISGIFTDKGRETAKRLLKTMVNFDVESEKYNFVDDDGNSLSVDAAGFKSYIENSQIFAPLVEAKSSVGGNAKNALNTGLSGKSFHELTGAELSAIRKSNPAEYERLKSQNRGH